MKNTLINLFLKSQEVNRIRVALYLLVACSLVISIKFSSICIILLCIHSVFSNTWKEKADFLKEHKWLLISMLLFFMLFLISLTYTENKAEGWKDIESKLSLLVFPLAILSQKRLTKLEIKLIVGGFSHFVFWSSVVALLLGLFQKGKLLTNQELAIQIGMHASYLSLYLVLAFSYFIYQFRKSKGYQYFYLLLTALSFILLLLLASRIILVSTFLIGGVWIFFFNYSHLRFTILVSMLAVAIAAILLIPSVKVRFVEAIDFKDKVELDADINEHKTLGRSYGGRAIRVAIWTCSMDVVKEHWQFGVGAGDVHKHLQQSYKDHVFEFAYKHNNYNAHNLFIETIIAIGVIGLILIIAMLWLVLKKAIKDKCLLQLTFILSFIMLSIMESSFNVHRGLVYFMLFACVFQQSTNEEKKYIS